MNFNLNTFSQHINSFLLFYLINFACTEYTVSIENNSQNTRLFAISNETTVTNTAADEGDNENAVQLKQMLEAQYKFKNDNTSTRFRIAGASEDKVEDEAVFRAYASRRIVGGMMTSIWSYPYTVSISRGGRHWCGGSIIDEQWILSAGHCFEAAHVGGKKQLEQFLVRAGSSYHNRGGYQAKVNKAFFPEEYEPGGADYDYCLTRLDRPLPIGMNIAVLNLPSKDFEVRKEDVLVVTGWGSMVSSGVGPLPERVRFVPVPVIKTEDCQNSYRFYITTRMICAGYAQGGKDACNHDSGGPAVRHGVLIGIVSFGGKQCGDPRSPGVYSRVSEVSEWVDRIVKNNEASDDPSLQPRIKQAKTRELELQTVKSRVEVNKNRIKEWLEKAINSPRFIDLALKKLKNEGFRRADMTGLDPVDEEMEDENLSHLIREKILEPLSLDNEDMYLRSLSVRKTSEGIESN